MAGGVLILVGVGLFWFSGCTGFLGTSSPPELTGWVEGKVLVSSELPQFRLRYDTVEVNADLAQMIGQLQPGIEVLVFFGSWCGDSRREVPHFMKIAERAGIPVGSIRYYGLDRTKRSPDGLTDRHRIERVPTFVFLRDGKEIGRVTELPRSSLEGDIYEILVADAKKRGQAG
jgi:thiol-disulfide isomerase/thioredoxin